MRFADLSFFIREAFRGIRLQRTSNIVSAACIALAFVSLSLVVGFWANMEHMLDAARSEAEIVIYLAEDATTADADAVSDVLASHPAVWSLKIVTPEETFIRVEQLLGPGLDLTEVLEGFNPFSPSLEVGVSPEDAAEVAGIARGLPRVEVVRDNEEILGRLASLTSVVRWLGAVATLTVVLITLALVSHIIRLGISARREEMETLRLLGASESFLAAPFIIEGAVLGASGAVICLLAISGAGPWLYGLLNSSLPFIPLVSPSGLFRLLASAVSALGLTAGILGSLISVRSA